MKDPTNNKESEPESPKKTKLCRFDTLVLSGGAAKCISLLGALEYAKNNYLLDDIKRYVGTSAGSIICYLLAIGYSPSELILILCRPNNILDKLKHPDLVNMANNNGALSFNHVRELLEKLTIEKVGKYLTMEGLKNLKGVDFVCCTYNVSEDRTEYLSPDTHPDIPCLTAIRMSSNLPMVFPHFKYMGSFYVDGGITANFPIRYGDEIGDKVLGIYVESLSNKDDPTTHNNILKYVYKLLCVPAFQTMFNDIKNCSDKCTIIPVDSGDTLVNTVFDFNLTTSNKLDLFSSGYRRMKEYFDT